jgi:hypothetical protein
MMPNCHTASFKTTALAFILTALIFLCASSSFSATSYNTMLKMLRLDAAASPQSIHLYQIGQSSTKTHGIWMVRLASSQSQKLISDRPKVLFICRQHGDEPVSTEASLKFIALISSENSKEQQKSLGDCVVYIIPMANPDGAEKLTRLNGVGADLNRDWGKFTQPETRAIYTVTKSIKPLCVVDMHSWTLGDSFESNSVEAPEQSGAIPELAQMAQNLQLKIINNVQKVGGSDVTPFTYNPSGDITLCHRFFASKQHLVSLLVETSIAEQTPSLMIPQITMDMTAFKTVIQSTATDQKRWIKIAKLEKSNQAQESALVTQFGGLTLAQQQYEKMLAKQQRTIRESLAAYVIAILIALCFLGRQIWGSILRLLSRVDVAVIDNSHGYMTHRRYFFSR